MNKFKTNAEDILRHGISGFHEYSLTVPARLSFVSRSLTEMTGYGEEELLDADEDRYAAMLHPADRQNYADFIHKLSLGESSLKTEYRIIKKDGSQIYVSDNMTSKLTPDGTLAGYSVLTDITELKKENNDLHFLNDTIPCGFLKYTCEKTPKVTYINDRMQKILRFPEASTNEIDCLELYRDNIFLMIPMEERRRFALYLNRVYSVGTPVAGEMTVLRCDGTKAHLFGWVTKSKNEDGTEEFQSVCMDVTERYLSKKKKETERYIKALTDVYDKIFEYDFANNTVNCLYSKNSSIFGRLQNVPMQLEQATESFINSTVTEEDSPRVKEFFKEFFKNRNDDADRPHQITYRAFSTENEIKTYRGVFIKLDSNTSLFCCRRIHENNGSQSPRIENDTLKNMQKLVMHFSDGIAAFEIRDDLVTPLYASENVCEFFGYTREEWMPMMEKSTPLKSFISKSNESYERIDRLLQNGEAEFTYFDLSTGKDRRIKAVCSEKSPGASPRYVMLYNIDETEKKAAEKDSTKSSVYIRTFGYFDVFVNGTPIAFRSQKSKELFALLVDRRGGFVTSEEAISFLWEDEAVSSVTLARYRKVALRLKNILEEYGIADVIESVDGKRRIVTDKVNCDLYDYLSGKEEHSGLFKGSYLSNYSWGETTLAELSVNVI